MNGKRKSVERQTNYKVLSEVNTTLYSFVAETRAWNYQRVNY